MGSQHLADLFAQQPVLESLRQSIVDQRLAHAYLFSGAPIGELDRAAQAVAEMLICLQAPSAGGRPCGICAHCRRIDALEHPDVHWVRPASKSRVITIEQVRELIRQIQLRPHEAAYKVGVISGADRLNPQAANAFLKTLEEPPARSVLILLSTEPGRILETILSRCLRLNFSAGAERFQDETFVAWLQQFSDTAVAERGSILSRYRLL